MKNSSLIRFFLVVFLPFFLKAQNSTVSPYSRYGVGEIAPPTFAHNRGMGGAFIALKPDSTMPIFLNTGNPAAYALIKLTSLEVGGLYFYSSFKSNSSSLNKWSANFAYGALGFPIRNNGGACFGIMPYSSIGYNSQNTVTEPGIGSVLYQYQGSGGLNKAFVGYGIMPFKKRLTQFRRKHSNTADSAAQLSRSAYRTGDFFSKMLSDFSIGFNADYVFGGLENETNIAYPNTILYNNTYVGDVVSVSAVTGNFGVQTAITIDSVPDHKGRRKWIHHEVEQLQALGVNGAELDHKRDSLERNTRKFHRGLAQRVKFTLGYYMALNNSLNAQHSMLTYNYSYDGTGAVINQDTLINSNNQRGKLKMPLEQGIGVGFKKGERLNFVADFAITNWQDFKYFNQVNTLKRNYRVAAGVNFVPEKYAAGSNAFFRRINYRFGVSYQTGYIDIRNTLISDRYVSLGIGLPVGMGRISSMVNISGQLGQMGTTANNLLRQNYFRVNFGFTFSDRWFQKYREN